LTTFTQQRESRRDPRDDWNTSKSNRKDEKAEIASEEALRIWRHIHCDDHKAVTTVLQELGDLMDDLGEYNEAMNCYYDALDIRRKRFGSDDASGAETLYSTREGNPVL